MPRALSDYLISQEGLDLEKALQSWHWLVPESFTVWIVTRIADMFLVYPDGSVHMLDLGAGTLVRVAASRDEFGRLMNQEGNAENWFAFSLVDQCVAAGLTLQPGQCYGFLRPPALGGDYTVDNVRPISFVDHVGAYGTIHEQIKDLPDGTEVVLKRTP